MAAEVIPASRQMAKTLIQAGPSSSAAQAAAATAAAAAALPEHGQHIFVYGHFRTNQIVYSLTRIMRNNRALKQLPYLGKKSKPAALRKDHWRPLATLTFPSGRQGLNAYKELREFRMRHEHEWDFPDLVRAPKAKVARRLQDQKANSIADMAYVLIRQDRVARYQAARQKTEQETLDAAEEKAQARLEELRTLKAEAQSDTTPEGIQKFKALKAEKQRLARNLAKPVEQRDFPGLWKRSVDARPRRNRGVRHLRGLRGAPPMTMDGVQIHWANILDAEFAADWPKAVVHDSLQRGGARTRNIASTPQDVAEGAVEEAGVGQLQENPTVVSSPAKEPSTLRRLIDRLTLGKQGGASV